MTGTVLTIPSTFYEFAFNADPNQSLLPPYWQNLSTRVLFAWNTTRGRQYELDVNETGEWNARLANADGALDPSNTASAFAPNVKLFRQGRIRITPGVNLLPLDQATAGEGSGFPPGPLPAVMQVNSGAGYTVTLTAASDAFQGSQVYQVTVPSGQATPEDILDLQINQGLGTLITAGVTYAAQIQARIITGSQNLATHVSVNWLNSAGGVISTTVGSNTTITGGSTTWVQLAATGQAPAGAVAAVLRVVLGTTTTSQAVYQFDAAQLEVNPAPSQFTVPGSSGVNLLPQTVANGTLTMSPVTDAATNYFYSAAGSLTQATNLSPAAPTGAATAVGWTSPAGTTNASPLYAGAAPSGASATGPVADCVQVTAGAQYTASVYMMRTSSADATIQVQGVLFWFDVSGNGIGPNPFGTATTISVGSWARVTVTGTAPAGAVWCRISFGIATPSITTASNTLYAAGWQIEAAGTASSWADPGPTYYVINAMAERLPQAWTELDGTYGTSEPVFQDALGALAIYNLKDPLLNELLALKPTFLFPLSDPKGSSVCADLTGNRPGAPVENSPAGVGSLTFGSGVTATAASGLMQGTAGPVATFANNPNGASQPVQEAETFVSIHKTTVSPGPPVLGNWTRIIHFRAPAAPTAGQAYVLWESLPATFAQNNNVTAFDVGINSGGTVHAAVGGGSGVSDIVGFDTAASFCDGNWHQVVVTCDGSGNVAAYVDTVAMPVTFNTTPITLPMVGISSDVLGASVQLGATYYRAGHVGDMACAVEFPTVLTTAQIANLYNSFRSASSGESSGARYRRVLTWIGWSGKSRIDTGQTASMGPATDLTGATALDALNNVALSENGDSYAATDGALVFKARSARYNQRTPVAIFGEGAPVGTVGEWPCEIAAIEYDPSHLAGIVQVTQYQGPVFTAQDSASQQRYFPRTYQRTINVTSANEAQDAANYLLSQLKDPHLRADTIHLHPSVVPGLFRVCAALEKGQRIRLIKRPTGAPAITVDAFIEQILWSWDPDTGDVFVDLQASPADLANYWQLGALHGTLSSQANSGTNTVTINALADSAVNPLAASLPGTYSLRFEPGTARDETIAIAPGGIPSTNPGYTTASIALAANLAFTHPPGSVWCEPLPTGYTDPTTWDASSVLGAMSTTLSAASSSGTNTITVKALPDAKLNPAIADLNTGDLLWIGLGTANYEGYNLAHPNIATAGEGALPLATGSSGAAYGVSAFYGTPTVTASATAWQGANVWQTAVSGGAATGNALINVVKIPVAALLAYTWSIYARSATSSQNPQVHASVQWLDANGNSLGTVNGSTVTLTGSPTAAFTRLTVTGTAPAGAVWASVGVVLDSAPASAWSFHGDGLQLEQNPSASTFQVCPQVKSVSATVPGYSTVTITLAANLANNHFVPELVCEPLPPGATSPSQIAATARLAY